MELIDACRYYLERADAVHTRRISVLIQRSFFRPLTRVRYELIGQDRALEQLFRVLSMHSRDLAASPMVVMLCGQSIIRHLKYNIELIDCNFRTKWPWKEFACKEMYVHDHLVLLLNDDVTSHM